MAKICNWVVERLECEGLGGGEGDGEVRQEVRRRALKPE